MKDMKFENGQELLDLAIKYYQMHNTGMALLEETLLSGRNSSFPVMWRKRLNEVTTGITLFHLMKRSYIYYGFDLEDWDSTFDPVVKVTPSDIISNNMYFPK